MNKILIGLLLIISIAVADTGKDSIPLEKFIKNPICRELYKDYMYYDYKKMIAREPEMKTRWNELSTIYMKKFNECRLADEKKVKVKSYYKKNTYEK